MVTTSMAISCMWAWMIPHFYIEFTEYRLALERVSVSGAWNSNSNNTNSNTNSNHNASSRDDANRATVRGVCSAVLIISIIYIGSLIGVGMSTKQPDPDVLTKSDAIIIGVGRMLSACLLAYFSVELPRWLGVTYSSQKLHVEYYKQALESASNKELSFRVCWSFLGHFFTMYPFLVMYFCNEEFGSVVLSTGVGIAFGFTIVYLVWLGHTKFNHRNRTRIAILLSLTITLSSSAAFSAGCWYVKEVWHDNNDYTDEYTAATFFVWLALCLLAHSVYYRLTQRKLAEAHAAKMLLASEAGEELEETVLVTDGEGASQSVSEMELEIETMKGEWRYQSQVFQPPRSINCVASELAKSFTSLPSLMKNKGRQAQRSGGRENAGTATATATGEDDSNSNNTQQQQQQQPHTVPGNVNTNVNNDVLPGLGLGLDIDGMSNNNDEHEYITAVDVVVAVAATSTTTTTMTRNRVRVDSGVTFATDGTTGSVVGCCPEKNEDPSNTKIAGTDINIDIDIDIEEQEQEQEQEEINLSNSNSNADSATENSDIDMYAVRKRENPTLWHMMKANSCCRRRRHYKAPPRKGWDRCLTIVKWTLWAIACGMHVTFTIINIGATQQQNKVRVALPGTYEMFYPPDYTTGTMCAWNLNNIDESSSPDNAGRDIRTFDSLQDVVDANYTVIHCGECSHCSNWNDLSLQWTTRDHLAGIAKDCTKVSLLGSLEDVQQCNEDRIGFTEECSMCWTHDEICARNNCLFIFIHSVFTNQVNNFNVGPGDITSATCDEAMCGPAFIPCSGATRRRMNIVSDIPRPVSQQCNVASEDWSVVFDHP